VRNGRAELVELLLEHGADMTIVGGEGTPRDVALRAKLPEMMALLDKEGTHIHFLINHSRTRTRTAQDL